MKPFYSIVIITLVLCACQGNSRQENSLSLEKAKVLFVVSNATHYGTSNIETTNNFPEIVYAYAEFVEADIEVDFVSPNGGQVPIGYIHSSDSILQHYLLDQDLIHKLKNTLSPTTVALSAYGAIYYVGGGSAMFGVPENKAIQKIARHIVEENGGTLSAICHGTAGIVNIKTKQGYPLIKDKSITGFPDAFEDTKAAYYKQFPFSIAEAISDQGARFEYSKQGWDGFYLNDGNIVTGQDPSGAQAVAQAVIKKLEQKK